MHRLKSFFTKALGLGPVPYFGLAVAIFALGAVFQMRLPTADNFAGGRSFFGVMAQVGGAIGMIGLFTLAVGGLGSGGPGSMVEDLPAGSGEARIDVVPARMKPEPRSATGSNDGPQTGFSLRLPRLDASPAARWALRILRQIGTRMLRQKLRR